MKKNALILVMDDEELMRNFLSIELENSGYNVILAENGAVGLELVKQKNPDLIILDVMMPVLNGYSVCSFLKGDEEYRLIPIIMLTARNQEADSAFDEEFKPEAYMVKPFRAEDLLDRVEKLLESRQRMDCNE